MSSILTRESSSEAVFLDGDGDGDAAGGLPDARIDPVEVQAGLVAKQTVDSDDSDGSDGS